MEEQRPDTERKRDGFRGERMIVLPTEAFSDYVKHPLVRRLYLTDVGFFPSAAHHYRERREGLRNIFFCTVWMEAGRLPWRTGRIRFVGRRRSVFRGTGVIVIMPRKRIPGVFSGSISRERIRFIFRWRRAG